MQVVIPTMSIESLTVDHYGRRATVALRPSGVVATVLGWFGLSKSQTYEASSEGYRVTTTSVSTLTRTYIPWPHAAGSSFVCSKPVELLFMGFGLLTGAFNLLLAKSWLYGGGMAAAGAALVIYFLMSRKTTSVRILADSGASETFKVHTTPEQLEQLQDYYDLLSHLILAAEQPAPARIDPESSNREEEKEAPVTTCPNCRAQMRIKPEFIGRRAACRSCQRPFVVN